MILIHSEKLWEALVVDVKKLHLPLIELLTEYDMFKCLFLEENKCYLVFIAIIKTFWLMLCNETTDMP